MCRCVDGWEYFNVNISRDSVTVTEAGGLMNICTLPLLTILHAAPRQQLSRPGSSVQPR